MKLRSIDTSLSPRESYFTAGLAAHIEANGLLRPVVVDQKGRLLRGFRRLHALQSLGTTDDVAVVELHIRSLKEQEIAVYSDERDEFTVDLNAWEVVLGVGRLCAAGCTQCECAEIMRLFATNGTIGRHLVRRRLEILKLSKELQREYRKLLLRGVKATPYRMRHLDRLLAGSQSSCLSVRRPTSHQTGCLIFRPI